ncbi:NADH dehydrogenase, FAD-containing subunit [Bacillus sp. OxB-1]|uniref:sce7726 family protein n=1 Tax=Bacillus sp. (strain OxB-1) TaxID=98228 RepID=UPI000581D54B|nr:sce7726 family protein [Bacillus sp. OxB-1]BAQ09964.1 NADH dehydrogenase, FAD-containing subunit [Bacillus sp. OxB-1]
MVMLKDNDIRKVLLYTLESRYSHDNETKIVNEMGILHGQSRVDVAVINGILHGYEIKSESDTLVRLPSQINDYSSVFDRMTIVVQRNYLEAVRTLIPKWWGIMLVTKRCDRINIREVRKGRVNPNTDPLALSHLLWRDEALEILKERGLQRGYLSKPRKVIYERLTQCLEIDELRRCISIQLRSREHWLSD